MLPTDTSYTLVPIMHITTAMFPLTSSGFMCLPFVFFLAGRSSSSEPESCEHYVADKLLAMHANQPGNWPLPNTIAQLTLSLSMSESESASKLSMQLS